MAKPYNWIKRLRKKLELTQKALAHQMGVSKREVSRWENGHSDPNDLAIKELLKLVRKVGMSK